MKHAHAWLSTLGGCALLALCMLPSFVFAGDEPTADDFRDDLASVIKMHKAGQAKRGVPALAKLLAEHERKPYVYARRAELEDLARRMAFHLHAKVPDPASLVSGDLKKWDGSKGKMTIVYTPKTAKDLERSRSGRTFYLPMDIRGSSTLTIEGRSYPMKTADSPTVYFKGTEDEKTQFRHLWRITYGTPPYTEGGSEVWMAAAIDRFDGDVEVKICKKDISPAKRGKPYKLVLKVASKSITAKIGNKSIGKAKKGKDVWGWLGFECKGWTKATLSGVVEPSWLQSRIDKKMEEQRAAFESSYDGKKHLPAWLFEAPTGATPAQPADDEPGTGLPEELQRSQWKYLREIYAAYGADDFDAALKAIAALRKDDAPESVCCYLEARTKFGMDHMGEALKAIEVCCKLKPEFQDGQLFRARLLRYVGRDAESQAAYDAAINIHPTQARGYEYAALGMMYSGDLKAAEGFTRKAASKGVRSERLSLLGGALVKARTGPTWAKSFEYKSTNYHVLSDINKETCIEAARLLEDCLSNYRVNFGWVSRNKGERFRVYLFGGRAGFMRYAKDIKELMSRPPDRAAGLYSSLLKQLLIWNLPSKDEMTATVVHEGFHQYLDRFMPNPPRWFNEGLAVYYEDAERKRGKLVFGQVQDDYVKLLREKGLEPLREYIYWTARTFYERGHFSYAEGWLFCHMLRHGTAEHKALFKQLVEEFRKDEPTHDILRRVFNDELLKQLDADLKAYLKSL